MTEPRDAIRDAWKLEVEGLPELWQLHERLRREIRERHDRGVPFADALFDRWERAAALGFGRDASIYDSSLVLGAVAVGESTWIGPYTVLDGRGGLSIGHHCSISAGVQIYSHDTVRWALTGGRAPEERAATRLGDCCYVGPQTVIGSGVSVGDHSLIGAQSFVRESIPPHSIAVGTPARVVGRVEISGDDARLVYAADDD